jgi:uncharacterized metal-binding protein YceD (DUF177 family)
MSQRYTIAYKGLGTEPQHFDFDVDSDFFKRNEGSGIKGGSATVEVELERKPSMLSLCVHITGEVVVACDRCLEDCGLPVDFQGKLIVKFSEEEVPFDGEVMWVNPAESLLDLEQYIYERIVLALPFRRVHPEDVHGTPLCNPAMLAKFRIVTEEEFEELTAAKPLEEDPRWAKLKELKEKREE